MPDQRITRLLRPMRRFSSHLTRAGSIVAASAGPVHAGLPHDATRPVPLTPSHRPVWRRLRRICSCGLRWPCQDRTRTTAALSSGRAVDGPRYNGVRWAHLQAGRSGLAARGLQCRANGGRW